VNNFERLKKHALAVEAGLQAWADGIMEPETENEAIAASIIRHTAPMIIVQYSRLGIDIPDIFKRDGEIINVTPRDPLRIDKPI